MTSSNPRGKITQEDRDAHERYLADSEACIAQLKERLGFEAVRLDFTPDSLKFVDELKKMWIRPVVAEDFVLGMPPRPLTEEEIWWAVRLAYYLAEVLIRNLDAKWDIETRPGHAKFKRSVLRGEKIFDGVDTQSIILAPGSNRQDTLYGWYVRNFVKEEIE